MNPGTVHVRPRRSTQWRPVRRPPGLRRLRRSGPDVRLGRMLAAPVLATLLVSASAVVVPVSGGPATVGPVLGVALERAVRVSTTASPSTVTSSPSTSGSSSPAPLVVDPTVPGYLSSEGPPATVAECREQAAAMPLDTGDGYDRDLLARMIHLTFECVARVGGLGDREPTSTRRWDGREAWGFGSLAEQVAAEAVVVAYCESAGFRQRALERNNPWGYGGLFQMGGSEMRRFGPPDGDKFDPVDNTVGAASYFLWGLERGHRWGGWGPWAVVNTGYDDEVNDQVAVPVLPRFASTDPAHRGRTGPELPAWAVDPWAWTVPEWGGCPAMFGWSWPETEPADR